MADHRQLLSRSLSKPLLQSVARTWYFSCCPPVSFHRSTWLSLVSSCRLCQFALAITCLPVETSNWVQRSLSVTPTAVCAIPGSNLGGHFTLCSMADTDDNGWWIQVAAQPWRCTLYGKVNTTKAKVGAQCYAPLAGAVRTACCAAGHAPSLLSIQWLSTLWKARTT